ATLVVVNTGTAMAKQVVPNPLLPTIATVTGSASATANGMPTPIDIPGGTTATFTWNLTASGNGSLSMTGQVAGTDANLGTPGQTAVYTWADTEKGASPGSLSFMVAARGADALTGAAINSNQAQSNLVVVVTPPSLLVESVLAPARVSRGQSFPVSVTVKNTG